MCGITGFCLSSCEQTEEVLCQSIQSMADTLAHRGPDDEGIWVDPKWGIALGHRRLSILDLSPEGHQPMRSPTGRYVCVYNGEIYNYQTLGKELAQMGYSFRGHSDTEIILAALEAWGVKPAIQRMNGMFAIALFDRQEKVLHLIRDRVGIKPLYYGWNGSAFLFGSELKSLRAYPDWRGELDRDALGLYFQYNYIPCPHSIYQTIYKLPPGCLLSLPLHGDLQAGRFSPFPNDASRPLHPKAYWSALDYYRDGVSHPFEGTETEALTALETLLQDSVSSRMISDRPIGAFLSGGIDSSLIAALMQRASPRPVRTFTIGFREGKFNEAEYAKQIAQHLGTEHTEMYVTAKETLDVIPQLPQLYDEPFADSSQIPTHLLSKLTRQHVTVSLSGDGGDEIFAGYNRYYYIPAIWKWFHRIPYLIRQSLAKGIMNPSKGLSEQVVRLLGKGFPSLTTRNPTDSLNRVSHVLSARSIEEAHEYINSQYLALPSLLADYHRTPTWGDFVNPMESLSHDPVKLMLYRDLIQCLPDDMLTKVDRASMGVNLEVRVPLLDHRIIELAARLPVEWMQQKQEGKRPLRTLLHRYIPAHLSERPKQGFQIPVGHWIRHTLRDWSEELLENSRMIEEGMLSDTTVKKTWSEHKSGKRDWSNHLWAVLMLEAWLRQTS
ncbi:asparagine synthase (glutamine-hydrolyzing) [bacterium]|nr:asparagine synthase (glutamine-hydrolyzing) [bacterium]